MGSISPWSDYRSLRRRSVHALPRRTDHAMNPAVYHAMEAHDESSWYYRGKRAAIRSILQKCGIRPQKVIDIGCGTGRNSVVFEPRDGSSSYIGIEPAH